MSGTNLKVLGKIKSEVYGRGRGITLLRGDFKQSEYGKIVLPFTVLRRLDCLLESTKDKVLERVKTIPDGMDTYKYCVWRMKFINELQGLTNI